MQEGPLEGHHTVACGRECLNRIVCTECSPDTCINAEICTNRRFQLQKHAHVYPFKTPDGRGWGLKAGQFIRKGLFIIQYLGEIYSTDSEVVRNRIENNRHADNTYLMSIANNEVTDPSKKGNLARFINHSCDPNCETQKWNVNGEICIGIFSKRDIQEDDEITFDYRFDTHKTALTKCLCGSWNCRKYLGVIPSEYKTVDAWIDQLNNITCNICNKSHKNDSKLLLCDGCNEGYHTFCLDPPLKKIPKNEWYCERCSQGRKPKTASPKKKKVVKKRKSVQIQKKILEEIKETPAKAKTEEEEEEEVQENSIILTLKEFTNIRPFLSTFHEYVTLLWA